MADKCIGKLTLDTTGIDAAVKHVNDELKKLGAGVKVDLSKQVAAEVKKQLAAVEAAIKSSVKNIQNAANQATKAFSNIGAGKGNMQSLKSEIVDTTNVTRTLGRIVQSNGKIIEGILSETQTGYNALGEKVKEVTDAHGNLVRKIKDVGSQYKDALKTFTEYQSKLAQLTALDMTGKTNTSQYAKLYSEVEALADRWNKVDASVKAVVNTTEEAQRAARMYNDTIAAINAGQSAEAQEKALQNLVGLYQELYKYKAQADTFAQKGDVENADMYRKLAEGIQGYIDGIKMANAALDTQARQQKEVIKANIEYEKTIQANQYKENTENIQAYSRALVDLHNAQANFNKLVASGDLVEGTKRYADAEKEIDRLRQVATTAGNALDNTGRQMAANSREVQAAFAKMNDSAEKLNNAQPLNQVEAAYNRLTAAIKNYNLAKKAGNEEGMISQQKEIDSAMAIITSIEKIVDTLNVEANVRDQIKQKIEQAKIAQDAQAKGVGTTAHATNELESQVKSLVTRYLSLIAVIRTINRLMDNMVEYVSEYSDKMNEIQMITLKTDSEVAQLAETYRSIAKEMNVSSLDMADAAIYFTRQGLEAEEIEKRLKNVTMYAKAANVEFKDASEIITAVVNSMGLVEQEAEDGRNAAQRVADVFLQIGDHAATSGQEIGEAMQKAAASAGAFGVSMEWLASYIATVSETTRQEARTIGTAFNTIIARLHQIKSTGYNQEDETKVNDIAKALSKIDVVLMDQEGNWRDMEDILVDIAQEWEHLDGKTKSYIATTMAGVKQQNVFLALMNDMSKGAENGSRAFELYNMAIDSTGVAADKYSVYLDSVTAAQERLTIAQEEFYSILSEDVIKGWYNQLAKVIEFITGATSAMGGLNIVIPLVAGGITLLVAGFAKLSASITAAGSASAFFATVWETHPVLLVITSVIGAITALTTVSGILNNIMTASAKHFEEATKAMEEYNSNIQKAENNQKELANMLADIEENTELSSKELSKYNGLLSTLETISIRAKTAVLNLKNGFGDQKEQVEILNDELNTYIRNQQRLSSIEAIKKYNNYQSGDTYQFASRMMNWDSNMTFSDPESFAKALEKAYNAAGSTFGWDETVFGYDSPLTQANKFFPKKVRDEIKTMVENTSSDKTKEEMWKEIASVIWQEYFGGDTSYNIAEYLATEVNTAIDEAMNLIGYNMNPVDFAVVRKTLTEKIFGSDGQLSENEYKDFGRVIGSFISEMWNNDLDPSFLDIPIEDKVIEYISGICKRAGEEINTAVENDVRDVFENNPEFYNTFIQAMSEITNAGFDDSDLYDVLFHTPVTKWGEAVEHFREEIIDGLLDVLATPADGGEYNEAFADMLNGMFGEMDLKDLKELNDIIDSLLDVQVDSDQIGKIIKESETIKEMFESLKLLQEENGISIEEDTGEGAVKTLQDLIKEAKSGIKDIQDIDSAIESVKKHLAEGENINYGDIFGLIELHPELMTVIGDSEKLLEMLKKIREEAGKTQLESFKTMILQEGKTAGTKYESSGFETLAEYRASIEGNEEAIAEFDEEVERLAQNLQLADENFKKMTKDETEAAKEAKNYLQEAQKAFKENLSEVETLDSVIKKLQENGQIDFSNIINLASTHPEIMNFVQDTDTLIAALERLKEAAKAQTKASLKQILLEDSKFYEQSVYYDPRYSNMNEYLGSIRTMKDEWDMVNADMDAVVDKMVEGADATGAAAETWLEAQAKILEITEEVNWAKSNNFSEQINELQAAVETGGVQQAIEVFNGYTTEMKEAINKEYPEFIKVLGNADKAIDEQGNATRDLTEDTNNLASALSRAERLNNTKYFTSTAKAIKQLSEGAISASDAYDVYTKDLNKVTKAYEDILDVQAKMEYNAKEVNKDNQQAIDAADVNNLATLLGLTTDEILTDFPAAVSMFDELTGATGELTDMLNMLNDAAFIRITGTSDADFSAIQAGLISVQDLADEAVKKLLATGQWETQVLDLPQTAAVWHPGSKETGGGYWTYDTVTAGATVLKPTGNNPFRGSSTVTKKADTKEKTGRSGGGGGSSKDKNDNFRDTNTTTEVEKMLDLMSQVNAIQQYQQSYYQSQNKYYSQTGQLQGVIAYMQKEKEVLEGQNGTLESNIRRIEEYMSAKQAELASLSTEDEKYKEVADDFDKLQKAHQTYTKQMIDNKSAVEALNQAMEEQRKKIRQMEIDLRNLILGAIEDREKKRTDMLNAEIEMENTIFDLIVKRYEKERDEIIRTTDLKIDALNSERDLLEENLRIRKEEAEQEDKAAKLRELEVKYQRIIADPTRAKEAQQLKTEIDSLRKEMAWDLAEEEVKSQQDSIDQQIESLEDYKEYIENYYEDLFEHPQQLIAEMRDIMMGTQEEIINWLKQNDEEYKNSSENTQLAMVTGWEETYNEMKGILKTYWDEVEEIIAQGDDYIIEFLKNNSADYAAAGKLQAEAYVDEWKKQLDDLHKAHQTVAAEIAGSYSTIQQYSGSGSSSSSSNGGGSNKGGGTSKTTATTANMTANAGGSHYYEFAAFGKNYSADKNSSGQYFANRGEAYSAAEQKIDALYQSQKATLDKNGANAYGYNQLAQAYKTAKNSIRAYKTGGIADYTGPAWVDGSPQDPERILTPYQNKLFESFVKTLEKMATISIPSMPNFGALETTGANPVSVGDIIVNVDNLDTDDDYEEMADRVCEILTERIGRTAVVGGLRIRST